MTTYTVRVEHGTDTSFVKVRTRYPDEAMHQALLILRITYGRVERIVVSDK